MKSILLIAIASTLGLGTVAQTSAQAATVVEVTVPVTLFRATEISGTVQAVSYLHRSGESEVGFAGTALMPSADGHAKVRSKRGTMEVEAEFGNLQSPITFGAEYLTYVLWAISPEGRAVNLGEVLVGGNDRSKLTATTDLQAFALIVTAEPYYAVPQPSNVLVLENVVRSDTKGTSEAVEAKYELMQRGGYLPTGYNFDPVVLSANLPLEFYEARNALRIARSEGANQYATESYQHAEQLMKTAEAYAVSQHMEKKPLIAAAREAVQTAEDAREIAVKKIGEILAANERQASIDAEAASQAQAANATLVAEQAQSDAAVAQAATAKAQADMAANQATASAAVNAAQADADRARLIAQQAQQGEHQAIVIKQPCAPVVSAAQQGA